MIIYFVWAIILTVHRSTVIHDSHLVDGKGEFVGQLDAEGEEVYNPAIGGARFDANGDDVPL